MLGLGLAISVGKRILGGVIEALMSTLRGRAEHSENNTDSKAVVKDIDNYELLDKASILLTPTATSNARVHSVKTYTGDELVTNGAFDTDSDWSATNSTINISNGVCQISSTSIFGYLNSTSSFETVVGGKYLYRFDCINRIGSGDVYMQVGTTQNGNNVANQNIGSIEDNTSYSIYFTATSTTSYLRIGFGGSGTSATIDNVSVLDVSSDFDFDRASSATRINSDGLVQDMQSITDPELILNGDFEELGDEEVTNGTFDTDSDWSKGTGWTIENGQAVGLNATGNLSQSISFTNGKTYKITFEVSNYTSGQVRLQTNEQNSVVVSANGIYTEYLTMTTDSSLIFNGIDGNPFNGSIDNISVQQVDPNDRWTLGTGWSVEDGVASYDNSGTASLTQSFTWESGKTYEIQFEVSDFTSNYRFDLYSGSSFIQSAIVTDKTTWNIKFNGDGGSTMRFRGLTTESFSIDNISVKDITFSTDVDLARINYDSNGDNGHILLEPTSTNLITYSEDFSQTTWTKNDVLLEGGHTAPDGSSTAYKVTSNGGNAHLVGYNGINTSKHKSIWAY